MREIGKREIVILGSSSTVGPLFHHSACFQYQFPCDPHFISWFDRFHTECCEFLSEHPTISMIITQHDFYFSRGHLSTCGRDSKNQKIDTLISHPHPLKIVQREHSKSAEVSAPSGHADPQVPSCIFVMPLRHFIYLLAKTIP